MTGQTFIARARDAAARQIGHELMIMSGRDSALFGLNETAALLWQAADGVTPLAEIVEKHVCTTFDVDFAIALEDAESLVAELVEHGVLVRSEQPLAPNAGTGRSA